MTRKVHAADGRHVTLAARSHATTAERRADAPRHLAVVLDHAAQIAAEAILVELLAGLRIPQPAAVRREFVAQHERRRRDRPIGCPNSSL